jgi:hypothetical protein
MSSQFDRDPTVEEKACELLGYTVAQVKRKTITQLKKELDLSTDSPARRSHQDRRSASHDQAHSGFRSPASKTLKVSKTVRFQQQPESSSPVDLMRSEDPLDTIAELHRLTKRLDAKRRFTRQLEADPDFSRGDLQDWLKSIERLEKRIRDAGSFGDSEGLEERCRRREEKIREMHGMGLLDSELRRTWKEKQEILWQVCDSLQSNHGDEQ